MTVKERIKHVESLMAVRSEQLWNGCTPAPVLGAELACLQEEHRFLKTLIVPLIVVYGCYEIHSWAGEVDVDNAQDCYEKVAHLYSSPSDIEMIAVIVAGQVVSEFTEGDWRL